MRALSSSSSSLWSHQHALVVVLLVVLGVTAWAARLWESNTTADARTLQLGRVKIATATVTTTSSSSTMIVTTESNYKDPVVVTNVAAPSASATDDKGNYQKPLVKQQGKQDDGKEEKEQDGINNNNDDGNDDDDSDEPVLLDKDALLREARVACAKIDMHPPSNFQFCVDDVMLTHELGLVGLWDLANSSTMSNDEYTLQQARIACATMQDDDDNDDEAALAEIHPQRTKYDACVQNLQRRNHNVEMETTQQQQQQQQQQADNDVDGGAQPTRNRKLRSARNSHT